jgi:hypothetical protein
MNLQTAERLRRAARLRAVASALVAMVEQSAYCWLVLDEPYQRDQAVEALVVIWESAFNALAAGEPAAH